jgi:hypothetical protein
MNFLNPVVKFLLAACMLSQVAVGAAGHRIFDSVPQVVIFSVNPIVNIVPVVSVLLTERNFHARFFTAVKTVLLGNLSEVFFGQSEFQQTPSCPVQRFDVNFVKGRFAEFLSVQPQSSVPGYFDLKTATTLGAPPHCNNLAAAVAFKFEAATTLVRQNFGSFVLWNFLKHCQFTDSISGLDISCSHTTKELILT